MNQYQPNDYEIRVWWSEQDNVFLPQMLDMLGIMAHGETPKNAARESYAASQLTLACLAVDGKQAPAPSSRVGFHAGAAGASQ
jgi:predicted RNase H-like HicB family nuclease